MPWLLADTDSESYILNLGPYSILTPLPLNFLGLPYDFAYLAVYLNNNDSSD